MNAPHWYDVFTWRGRASRLWWWCTLLALAVVFGAASYVADQSTRPYAKVRYPGPPDLYGGIMVLCIWMQLMNNIRRYHDMQKSAWRLLLALIPVLGAIWVFCELAFVPSALAPGGLPSEPSARAV